MRILFVSHANTSHLYFLAPLAWALRTAGHQVHVASPPEMVEDTTRVGLTAVSVGEETHAFDQMPKAEPVAKVPATGAGGAQPRQAMPAQSDYARENPHGELNDVTWNGLTLFSPESMIDELVAYARSWRPHLVIWDALTYAGSIAARASGAAHARLLFGTDALAQLRAAIRTQTARTGKAPGSDPMQDWLQPILERYGCDFDEEIAIGQWTIDTMPPWHWRPSGVHYLQLRHVPYNRATVIPKWLYEKPTRKRVCVTLGTTHRDFLGSEASASDLLEAMSGLDIEVVATLNNKQLESLSHIPDNVRTADFVPMNVLLPTCSAVVHHGGGGAFAAAVEHAVPQLVVPGTYWCIKWWGPVAHANSLTEQGAGLFVADSDHLTADLLREDLTRVLKDPSFAENAARLRTEMLAVPSPNDVVPALERLTAARAGTLI